MRIEQSRLQKLRRGAVDRWSVMGFRSVVTRSRRAESRVDSNQLTVRNGQTLRVMATEVNGGPLGADTGDIGKMVFIPGYSRPGGDDFIIGT